MLDATLFISEVELQHTRPHAHANILIMKRKAHYPDKHNQVKYFTGNSGAQQVSFGNAFRGPIPERIY